MIAKPIGGLVLLAGLCLVADRAGAESQTGCVSGLKRLFRKGSNYATLAEHLRTATPSSELGDNIAAVRSLLEQLANEPRDTKGPNFENGLVTAFSSLEAGDDNERLCGATNLANLRLVAEAMRKDGNLGPRSASESIRRLNRILIKLIARVRGVCFTYLDSKWPVQSPLVWVPPYSSSKTQIWQLRSDTVRETFDLRSYLFDLGPLYRYDKRRLGKSLSIILELSALEEAKKSQPRAFAMNLASSLDSKTIIKQLEEYILAPCDELQSLAISISVLKPYFDLIVVNRIINGRRTDLLKQFYKNKGEEPALEPVPNNKDVQRNAHQLRTCAILRRIGVRHLARLIVKDRRPSRVDSVLSYLGLEEDDDDEDALEDEFEDDDDDDDD